MKPPDAGSGSLRPSHLHAQGSGALRLAAHGYCFVGATQLRKEYGTIIAGQAMVEYFIPERLLQPWPVVMVHGGGGQSLDMLATPDGRPGWVDFFLAQGYAVYTLDRPGLGRSPYHPDALGPMSPPPTLEFLRNLFTHPAAAPKPWPGAEKHNRWPEPEGEETLVQLAASCGPSQASFVAGHRSVAAAGRDLLQRTGPAILLTHSAGGPCGWAIADAAPGLVKGILAVEPQGPPYLERPGAGRFDFGITASPLAFEPPLAEGEVLAGVENPPPRSGLRACMLQPEPARKLPHLAGFPIAVVTAEASWMALDNHGTVDFLRQAGCDTEHLRLEESGIHGNGHMVMAETNSDEVAMALHRWLVKHSLAKEK